MKTQHVIERMQKFKAKAKCEKADSVIRALTSWDSPTISKGKLEQICIESGYDYMLGEVLDFCGSGLSPELVRHYRGHGL